MQGKNIGSGTVVASAICGLILTGCTQAPTPQPSAADGSAYQLDAQPADAQEVIAAREAVKDGETIAVVGRIGGSITPWITDRAAFTIVDNSIEACSDIPGDQCKTPWDYCCRTAELASSTALVKVVDDEGKLVEVDARQLLGLKELDRVTVQGQAVRDDQGNLTVLARGVYVEP